MQGSILQDGRKGVKKELFLSKATNYHMEETNTITKSTKTTSNWGKLSNAQNSTRVKGIIECSIFKQDSEKKYRYR